jgi:hypothetical protein
MGVGVEVKGRVRLLGQRAPTDDDGAKGRGGVGWARQMQGCAVAKRDALVLANGDGWGTDGAASLDDIGDTGIPGGHGDLDGVARVDADIEVLRGVAQGHRRGGTVDASGDDAHAGADGAHFGNVGGVEELPGWFGVAVGVGEGDEELEAAVRAAADRLFGVREAPAEEVAFGAAGDDGAAVVEGVFVVEGAGEAVGDDLDPLMRMRGEHDVGGHVVVHQGDKRVGVVEAATATDNEAPVHADTGHWAQGRRRVGDGARGGGHHGEGTTILFGWVASMCGSRR